ncbi:MAG TPA: glycosyltransferase [Candidatus Angelobacter sp.]|nr:glycosyltransferase [Candidatus Angelobacter sp.]
MKTKVAFLIGSLETGGAETQVVEMMNHIDRGQFELSLILFTSRGLERAGAFRKEVKLLRDREKKPVGAGQRAYHSAWALNRLRIHLGEIRPNVLHAFLPEACIAAACARLFWKVPCFVASRLSLTNAYRRSKAKSFADVVATRLSDCVIGNSLAIKEELRNIERIPDERTEVIYNGVDVNRFSPANHPWWRKQFEWTEDNPVFGNVANFIPYKRHIDFVKAASLIHAAIPKARFLLVGEDRGEMIPVRQAIAEAGLSEYVRIVPGTNTPELAFAAMDVYLCTSETEGLSNVLLEAMASGVPVIATHVGGNPEAIKDGFTGYLVPPRAPAEIAKSAIDLVGRPSLLKELSIAARRHAEQTFSLHGMVLAHEQLYLRLLRERRTPVWKRLAATN